MHAFVYILYDIVASRELVSCLVQYGFLGRRAHFCSAGLDDKTPGQAVKRRDAFLQNFDLVQAVRSIGAKRS